MYASLWSVFSFPAHAYQRGQCWLMKISTEPRAHRSTWRNLSDKLINTRSSCMMLTTKFCSFSYTNNPNLTFPVIGPQTPAPPNLAGSSATTPIAIGAATGAALLFLVPLIVIAWWRRTKAQDHFFDVPAEEDPTVHLGQLKRFSLRELQVATNSFSSKNVLGSGGFGKVYKGRLADGGLVAVKRLKEERTHGGELQFQTEVEMISMAVYRNLLRLKGFCMTPTERLLVYPYMVNGSVASCL